MSKPVFDPFTLADVEEMRVYADARAIVAEHGPVARVDVVAWLNRDGHEWRWLTRNTARVLRELRAAGYITYTRHGWSITSKEPTARAA